MLGANDTRCHATSRIEKRKRERERERERMMVNGKRREHAYAA